MRYEVFNIGLDLVEGYSSKIVYCIDYFGCFYSEQVLVEEDINIYRYKKGIKLVFVLIIKV
jgi:hypothetical protein